MSDGLEQENPLGIIEAIQAGVGDTSGKLSAIMARLESLEATAGAIMNQINYLPPQVRMLAGKIDGLTASISESRYRALLMSVLGIHDMAEQALRAQQQGSDGDVTHSRNYEVLITQLRQILEVNGLSQIPAEGIFNPEVHRAIERVPVNDEGQANLVLGVVRDGFRTEQSVLRYAEVRVGYYLPPEPTSTEPAGETVVPSADGQELEIQISTKVE